MHSRGQGYGRTAIKALEAVARGAAFASVLLYVFGHNTRAQRLCESCRHRAANVNMRKDFR